jgi:hypothetical protein
MLTPVKILVFITLILPIIITSFMLIIKNFRPTNPDEFEDPYEESKYSSLVLVNSSKSNPFIKDEKTGPILNAIWYILTLLATLFVSWSLFSS